jgi:hypothetical protein
MTVFKVPICPSCGAPLDRVEINETLTGIYDPKTGKYKEDGELETKCMQCNADLYEVFPDGPCNYQGEEEQQPEHKKRVKPMRLEMHKPQETANV